MSKELDNLRQRYMWQNSQRIVWAECVNNEITMQWYRITELVFKHKRKYVIFYCNMKLEWTCWVRMVEKNCLETERDEEESATGRCYLYRKEDVI